MFETEIFGPCLVRKLMREDNGLPGHTNGYATVSLPFQTVKDFQYAKKELILIILTRILDNKI